MDSRPVGRDAEIAEILAFLSTASLSPRALVISGDPGIGKTAVWQHVLQAAGRSSRVLSCRPTLAERPLAFSALDDLLGDVADEILPELAGPRRHAVEAALLRDTLPALPSTVSGADPAPPGRRVLARGVLDFLRVLSSGTPLLVAIDDAQWLDRPSRGVLEFCFRRLQREPLSILLTFHLSGPLPLGLDRALPPDCLGRMQLGPLSLGAIGAILQSRLGIVLPRYALTRLYEACGGNPFYALECARALGSHPRISLTSEPLPIPQNLGDLVRRRMRQLTPATRRVGRLVAASCDPRERLIRAACDDRECWTAIDQAIDDGIIERDGDMLRFTHPLLRSALYGEMTLDERRTVHRQLEKTAIDIEERAWHLALSADRPSDGIATVLGGAAEHAALRGAPEEAAALEEQAIRLTPADQPDAAREWIVRAADHHFRAGDMARSQELIQSALATCPVGPRSAPLLLKLATIYYHQSGWPLAEQTFRQAAEQAPEDLALRARAEQELAFARLMAGDLAAALDLATVSLHSAERAADPRLTAHSLARIAVFTFLRGHGARLDLLERAERLDASAGEEPIARLPMLDPFLATAAVLKWSDQLDEARLRLADRYRYALGHGDEASLPFLLYQFSELECWAGNWSAAEEYALEACRIADESRQLPVKPAALYSLALIRAHQGRVQDAREYVREALDLCDQTGNVPLASMLLSVLGFVAISLDDHQAAHTHLGPLAAASAAVGLGEPGVVKFLPDEIEALVALGQINLARSFARELEAQGKSLGRRWALATAARCRAHLAAVDGDLLSAQAACEQALAQHEQLPMPFELGRTLLVKSMIERRARRKSAARTSLGQALAIFDGLGAPLWAAKARRELSKMAARTPVDGLTETEQRIAALIAQGQTNREVATAMFVTENTVQTHLRHIFQKLSVRSRTELAARLLSASAGAATASRSSAGSEPP